MAKEKDKVTLKIPRPLYNKLKLIIADSGYNSVTDFVVFILRDLAASSSSGDGEVESVKQKLKNLGYL